MNRCTDIVAIHDAASVAVCVADKTVALHCATRAGVIVVRLTLDEFLASFRGPRDHNGRPFPAETALDVLKRDAAETHQAAPKPRRSRKDIGRVREACEKAFEWLRQHPCDLVGTVAKAHGVTPAQLSGHLNSRRYGEWQAIRRVRYGQANHTEVASSGMPLRKPGGKLL